MSIARPWHYFRQFSVLWIFLHGTLCLANGFLTNDTPQYISKTWQTEDGLPNNCINAIHQTRNGYLWLATREGLARFDGLRFTAMDLTLAPDLKNRSFVSICETRDGTLWVANEDGKLRSLHDGRMVERSVPANLTANFPVSKLFAARDGSLWIIITDHGLVRFKDGQFSGLNMKEGLANYSVRSLCEDKEGEIWIGTGAGVNRWNNGKISTYTVQNGLLHNSTRAIYVDQQENVWIASHFGLTRLKNGKGVHFTMREGLSENLISSILQGRDGTIWIGTLNGLNRFVNGKLIAEMRPDGTSYGRVNCLFEDNEANLWIGTRDGLSRLKSTAITVYTQQQGLTHNSVTSVLQDREENLWIGFWGGGVNRIQGGAVTAYRRNDGGSGGLSSDLVLTMHESRDGNLWFGMDYDGGMNLMRDERFIHYRELEGLKDQAVKVFQDDRQNNLWIGTRTALVRFKAGKLDRFTTEDGLPSDTIEAIHEDRAGRMWFGTSGGMALWRDGKFQTFTTRDGLSHNSITAIHEDDAGTFWLGTRGGGLNRVSLVSRKKENIAAATRNPCSIKVTVFTTANGLFSDQIFCVLEDDLGFLWMSSPQGIFRVNKKDLDDFVPGRTGELSCISFGKADGMASIECKGSDKTAGCKSRDGRLWFPTSKGLVSIDPHRVKINSEPPGVGIEEIFSDGRKVEGQNVQGPITRTVSTIEIPPGKGELEFHYTALSLSVSEKNRFKYKLAGVDSDWVSAGTRRIAHYNNIKPGNYTFYVIACNNDGVWNEAGAHASFALLPHLWQTKWFIALVASMAISFVAGTTRYITWKRVQHKLEHLEQQHAIERERTRIAQDIHDDIGATLTQISVLSQLAEKEATRPEQVRTYTGKITNTAHELTQAMDEIVWAINPKNDSLPHLVGYIFRFAEEFLSLTELRLRKERPKVIPDVSIPAEMRHNIFLVVKEAINNVVKHSGASEVRLVLDVTGGELAIKIEDNGRGFSKGNATSLGNGLENMKKRMDDIGGRLELSSTHDGTRIRLVVSITPQNNG